MRDEFNLQAEDACTEKQALNLISLSIEERKPYRFVLLDLDDPTIYIGRFMTALEKLLEHNIELKIDVYACSDNNSEP